MAVPGDGGMPRGAPWRPGGGYGGGTWSGLAPGGGGGGGPCRRGVEGC